MVEVLKCNLCEGHVEADLDDMENHLILNHKIDTIKQLNIQDFYEVYTLNKKEVSPMLGVASSLGKKAESEIVKAGKWFFTKREDQNKN